MFLFLPHPFRKFPVYYMNPLPPFSLGGFVCALWGASFGNKKEVLRLLSVL